MATQKNIQLYIYVDGINDIPFYGTSCDVNNENENVPNCEQVEIGAFKYEAKRMGGLPTISFTLYYPESLDRLWNENIYGLFNGRKFFLKQTPSEKVSNDDLMYEYSVELVDERIILDNTYFFNAVAVGDSTTYDQPLTNSTEFNFFGDISAFVKRLNSSLRFSKLQGTDSQGNITGYSVVIDEGVSSEEKFISFSDKFFSEAIQESYNTFEIPYYFVGKTIHVGYKASEIEYPFETGIDNSLLTINKQNANTRSINRSTAIGSSDNIPFYYPNKSPKGDIGISVDTSSSSLSVEIKDAVKFATRVSLNEPITAEATKDIQFTHSSGFTLGTANEEVLEESETIVSTTQYFKLNKGGYVGVSLDTSIISIEATDTTVNGVQIPKEVDYSNVRFAIYKSSGSESPSRLPLVDSKNLIRSKNEDGTYNNSSVLLNVSDGGTYILVVSQTFKRNGYFDTMTVKYMCDISMIATDASMIADAEGLIFGGWYYKGKEVNLNDLGLQYTGNPKVGDTIRQVSGKYITPSPVLLPPIYRNTSGNERFYNAINNTYTVNGRTLSFVKPYEEGNPRENIYKNEDIKPSIVGETNSRGQRIDMFSDIEFDYGDNDDTYEDEETHNINYVHPYFFVKLRRLPFNLFDQALENGGAMKIEMTSGRCGGCKFEIAVDDESKKNTVQVWDGEEEDENGGVPATGTLKRDENGRVMCGVNYFQDSVQVMQDIQNDTMNNEVWIALRKEEDTYGVLMPNAAENYYPEAGDTFIITNIKLPDAYIMRAEERLKDYLLTSMENDNPERFNFSMGLSRIFLEENPSVLASLDENSSLGIKHDGVVYNQYVSTYTYTMGENDILPEINVTLIDSLSVSANNIQKIASQVNMQVMQALNGINLMSLATPYFLRKDQDDEANGVINFKKGIKFGESGKIDMMPDNGARLTIDYLEVNKKATFNSLEIAEKKHVGGQTILTPSAMKCGEVEVMEEIGVFRCYFQTKEGTISKILNKFVVGDLAICQTYNEVGSKYYWRAVVGVGEDYIDLSINDCDEYSDIPEAGDTIVQLGNKEDKTRQAAIILSAYDNNAPSIIMYNMINSYSLNSKNVTGIIWNPDKQEPQMYSYGSFFFGDRTLEKNFITFQDVKVEEGNEEEGTTDKYEKKLFINADIEIGAGSKGLSNLSEWNEFNTRYNNTLENINSSLKSLGDIVDGVVENYFFEGSPLDESNLNNPARNWTTNEEKEKHIGDTYTNISSYEDDPDNAGKSWRWVAEDAEHSGYHWHPIADSDAIKALIEANKATGIANGKSSVYISDDLNFVPTNYKKGDLWILQSDTIHSKGKKGEILTAIRNGSTYSADDWDMTIAFTSKSEFDDFVNNIFENEIETIKTQVDGKAETYVQSTDPSSEWTTDDIKKEHVGDMWLNTSRDEVSGISSMGTAIYKNVNGIYKWVETDIPNELFDMIDGKAQVFVKTPVPPYFVGDLWVRGGDNPIMVCKTNRESGDFNADDWVIADERLEKLEEEIGGYAYIKEALGQQTEFKGGLVLSSTIGLGRKINDTWTILSGINGISVDSKKGGGIASWYGGKMYDREDLGETESMDEAAATVFRFDGSGYFAKGNLSFDSLGGMSFAKGKLRITEDGALILGDDIVFGSENQETIQTIISKLSLFESWFVLSDDGKTLTTTKNLLTTGQFSAGTAGTVSDGGASLIVFNGKWEEYTDDKADYALAAALGYDLNMRLKSVESHIVTIDTMVGKNETDISNINVRIESIVSEINSIKDWFTLDGDTLVTQYGILTNKQFSAALAGTASGGSGVVIFNGSWSEYTSDKSDYALAASLGYDLHSRVSTNSTNISSLQSITSSNTSRIAALEGKATNVSFVQSLSAGKQIGTISIDGKSTNLYAPSTYAWSEVTSKPTSLNGYGITDAIYFYNSDKYVAARFINHDYAVKAHDTYIEFWQGDAGWFNFMAGKYIVSGGTSSHFLKGDGSLDSTAYLTSITKSMVEGVLTGNITSHTHNYLSIYGGTVYNAINISCGSDRKIIINNTDTDTYYNYIEFQDNGTAYGILGTFGTKDLTWEIGGQKNIILHSGNYNSYAATKDHTHSQYIDLTSAQTIGGVKTFSSQIKSSVATGTSPFSIASTTLVGNLNADMIDGYHKDDILRSNYNLSTNFSLNDRDISNGIDFTSWSYSNSSYVNNQPYGDGVDSAASVVSFGTEYPFQIYSDYNSTDKLFYRSYNSNNGWKNWRQFAFLDSNVASATKLQTSRTIWGQSFDGTANVSGALTGVTSIAASGNVTIGGTLGVTRETTLSSTLNVSGSITAKNCHDFIINSNEFNFIPNSYSSDVHINYRTQGGSNGNIGTYHFRNGAGAYANVVCKDLTANSYSGYFNQSKVSSKGNYTHLFGRNSRGLGQNSVSLGLNSWAGIRNEDSDSSTYPYITWQWMNTEAITVNGSVVYGFWVAGNGVSQSYTLDGTTFTYTNDSSNARVIVIVKDTDTLIFGGKSYLPYNKTATLVNSKYIVGRGEVILAVTERVVNRTTYYELKIYTWSTELSSNYDFSTQVKINCATKVNNNNFNGASTYASGSYSVASGSYSVASGSYSVASGYSSVASGSYSVASGYSSVAS
ncbi:MAG: hypothetical protein ACI4TK_19825, partial [Agathobacter sp.]